MGHQYNLPDLRPFMSGRNHELTNPELPEPLLSIQQGAILLPPNGYDPTMAEEGFSRGFSQFEASSAVFNPTTNTPTIALTNSAGHHATTTTAFPAEKGWLTGFESGNNRWPRQETLSLLDIRSRLDSKFRDSNHKGPLWNEVSRIMEEEYGYQRSGKKCKEKFENLYKYYKKTKDCKASKQDGKHYRFFRQLEAICGQRTIHSSTSEIIRHARNPNIAPYNQTPTFQTINNQQDTELLHSPRFSNSWEFAISSSKKNGKENDLSDMAREKKGKRSWRAVVEELVDSHMRKVMEAQDAWMEKILSAVEQREVMVSKEEERKREESMRFVREAHELWARQRAWIEARDAALMEIIVKKHIENRENCIYPR